MNIKNRFELWLWLVALSISIFILSFFATFVPRATAKVLFNLFQEIFKKYKNLTKKSMYFN